MKIIRSKDRTIEYPCISIHEHISNKCLISVYNVTIEEYDQLKLICVNQRNRISLLKEKLQSLSLELLTSKASMLISNLKNEMPKGFYMSNTGPTKYMVKFLDTRSNKFTHMYDENKNLVEGLHHPPYIFNTKIDAAKFAANFSNKHYYGMPVDIVENFKK